MKEHEDIDTILELLKDLAKEYNEEIKKPTEFKDSQLQAFFEIIKSDNYFTKKYNENSEELRNIAIDINNAIKGKVTDQFLVNSKVKSSVIVELRSLLKKKYNYPPEKLIDSSKRFIESITEEIKTKPIKVSNQE
jgi:type I restriction enzyme R subunit